LLEVNVVFKDTQFDI